MIPGQLKLCEQRVLVVGDKDIRRFDQTDEDLPSSGGTEVEGNTLLIPTRQNPGPVEVCLGKPRQSSHESVQIPVLRSLDLHHFRPKIRHDRR